MKKIILTLGLLLACAYAFAQGISSAKDLQDFIEACNSGASLLPWSNADSVVVLTADIDLSKAKKMPQVVSFSGNDCLPWNVQTPQSIQQEIGAFSFANSGIGPRPNQQ